MIYLLYKLQLKIIVYYIVGVGIMKGLIMKNLKLLFIDAKDFLSNEVNRVFIAVIILGLSILYMIYNGNSSILKSYENILKSNEEILKAIDKTNDKVDFRYFNTTSSLEDIYDIEIDTKTGKVKKWRNYSPYNK